MVPMFLDINAPEFVLLLALAVILFGPERLPDLARKAARIVRYLRTVAGSAQEQLSKELGPGFENLDFRDLNPRTFVQKHLLDEVQPLIADVRKEISDVRETVEESSASMAAAIDSVRNDSAKADAANGGSVNGSAVNGSGANGSAVNGSGANGSAVKDVSAGGPQDLMAAATPVRTPFDAEAT